MLCIVGFSGAIRCRLWGCRGCLPGRGAHVVTFGLPIVMLPWQNWETFAYHMERTGKLAVIIIDFFVSFIFGLPCCDFVMEYFRSVAIFCLRPVIVGIICGRPWSGGEWGLGVHGVLRPVRPTYHIIVLYIILCNCKYRVFVYIPFS